MAEKILDSAQAGTTRCSCYLASINGNDSLELVWKNGQTDVQVQGGSSSSVTRKTPSFDGYSINPSPAQKAIGEEVCIAKSARLSTSYDFPAERDSELDSSQRNSHQSNDQNSCQLKESKLTATGHSYLCTSSTRRYCQCLPSAPHKKQRMDSSHTPTTNSLKQDLGKVNYFSNVLKPSLFRKSTYYLGNSTTLPTNNNTVFKRVEEIKASKVAKAAAAAAGSKAPGHDHSAVIDLSNGSSHGLTLLQGLKPLTSDAPKPVSFVTRSQEIPPDEQSETVGHNSAPRIHGSHGQYYNQTSKSAGLKAKGKAHDNNYYDEPLPESSFVCSLVASNNTNLCSRKHDDSDDSTYLTDNDDGPEDVVKVKLARKGTGFKRSRNTELHSLYERKRRDKINKKMRILKELIPNCNKKDKASMLDDAIEYLKTLKFQLQIMSMGLCMPLMMLPTTTHHMINTPYLPHLMGAGIGFRPGTGMIPCSLPQFPIASLPGINDNGIRMFGFPNQVPPMPISHAPFIPMVGNPSIQPLLATSTATKLAENQASARTHVLMDRLNMQQSKH